MILIYFHWNQQQAKQKENKKNSFKIHTINLFIFSLISSTMKNISCMCVSIEATIKDYRGPKGLLMLCSLVNLKKRKMFK